MSVSEESLYTGKWFSVRSRIGKLPILKKALLTIIAPVLLIVIWELASQSGWIRTSILPAPSTVAKTFWEMIRTGEIFGHLGISILRVLQGYVLGAVLGILLGILIGLFKDIEQIFSLIIGVLRPIPIMAWVPVLILWMGIDEPSKVTVIAIGSFWPILLNVVHGIKHTEKKYLEVAEIFEKSKWSILTKVIFPSALPAIFTGLRIGVGIAWMSVIGAELIAASSGIGYLIAYARELSQPDVMLVGVFSIGITGLFIDLILRKLASHCLKWNANVKNMA